MKRALAVLKPAMGYLLLSVFALPVLAQQPEAEGFVPYVGMKDQFTIALPVGWSVYDQQEVLTGKRGKTGPPVVFSSEVIDGRAMMSGDKQAALKVADQLSGIETGLLSGFALDRLPARYGMSCNGIDGEARARLLELLGRDPMFGRGRTIREKLHAEPTLIGGCQGLRVKGKGEARGGGGRILDVFAVSDGDVLFLFMLQPLEEHYAKNLGAFEKALSTLELALAPKGNR
jgi:hypothetical protein